LSLAEGAKSISGPMSRVIVAGKFEENKAMPWGLLWTLERFIIGVKILRPEQLIIER